MKDALGAWTPATQVQDPERAGSWLWPRLAPTVEAIWEMNHKIEKKISCSPFKYIVLKSALGFPVIKPYTSSPRFKNACYRCSASSFPHYFCEVFLAVHKAECSDSILQRRKVLTARNAQQTDYSRLTNHKSWGRLQAKSISPLFPNTHEGGPHSMSGSRVTAALSLMWLPLPPINQQSLTWYLCGGPSTLMPTPHPHLQLRRRTNR